MKSVLIFLLGGLVASAWWAAAIYDKYLPVTSPGHGFLWTIAGAITITPCVFIGIWLWDLYEKVDTCLKRK